MFHFNQIPYKIITFFFDQSIQLLFFIRFETIYKLKTFLNDLKAKIYKKSSLINKFNGGQTAQTRSSNRKRRSIKLLGCKRLKKRKSQKTGHVDD
jgi:hypothetical protein